MEIIEKIKALHLPEKQFVVMGSAILEVKGIRKAGDLDIIISKELFETLKNDPEWEYKTGIGTLSKKEIYILDNNKGSTLFYHIYGAGEISYFLNNPTRIEEIEGIFFGSLSNLLEAKSGAWNREKDLQDVVLIKNYLASIELKV